MKTIKNFDISNLASNTIISPTSLNINYENVVLFDQKLNAYFFGTYADVKRILTSPAFTTRPLSQRAEPVMGGRVLAQMEGVEHQAKRRAVHSGLTGKMFKERYEGLIVSISEDLLKAFLPTGQIDLVEDFGKKYSVLVTLSLLGLPTDQHTKISEWHSGITEFITGFNLSEAETSHCLRCSRELIDYLTPLIQAKILHPDDTFISMIGNAPDQPLSTKEIVALTLNILLAATEPADKVLAYLFKNLLDNPDQFDRVRRDRSLVGPAIDETLRLTPPVQLIPREAAEDVEVGGLMIKSGTLVFCMIGAANRDQTVYENADQFDIDRKSVGGNCHTKLPPHLAFGTGAHVCVGAAFSMMQIRTTANFLLDHMKDLAFADDFSFSEQGIYTKGPTSLKLKFTATSPNSTD